MALLEYEFKNDRLKGGARAQYLIDDNFGDNKGFVASLGYTGILQLSTLHPGLKNQPLIRLEVSRSRVLLAFSSEETKGQFPVFMYSILPTVVSLLFLSYGFYVIYAIGINRITVPFFLLCITTFAWQATWAVLFQMDDSGIATILISLGWCLILFLPTSLYYFLAEVCCKRNEIPWVYLSYVVSFILMLILLGSDLLIDGYYEYFFGFYPKAGLLHVAHVLQTSVVVTRGLWITYKKFRIVQGQMRPKLGWCIAAVVIYFFAAIDYLCNYGVEFYPSGVIFIAVALGIIAMATAKYHVMDDISLFALSAVHDMKTPLATVSMQAAALDDNVAKLLHHYRKTQSQVSAEDAIDSRTLEYLERASSTISAQIGSIKGSVDALMSVVSYQHLGEKDFHVFSIKECIEASLSRMPKNHIHIDFKPANDFRLFASRSFLIQVIINMINNAIDAIQKKGSGVISIYISQERDANTVIIHDTGSGIAPENLPHIFDDHFTTKRRGNNSGIGLAFCKNVMGKFKGDIVCRSKPGEYTLFELSFPVCHQCSVGSN